MNKIREKPGAMKIIPNEVIGGDINDFFSDGKNRWQVALWMKKVEM